LPNTCCPCARPNANDRSDVSSLILSVTMHFSYDSIVLLLETISAVSTLPQPSTTLKWGGILNSLWIKMHSYGCCSQRSKAELFRILQYYKQTG
jgi:hypothetical protein